jgi:hypothetical protein
MRRVLVYGAGALVALAALSVPADAAPAAPGSYDITATAVGVAVQSTQKPAPSIVTAGLVDSTAAFATSALSSYGTSESTGSPAYPGDLVAGGPALFCANVLPCPTTPPDYPLVANAVYPARPSSAAPAVGAAPAGSASAHAAALSTDAAAGAADTSTQSPVPVHVASAASSTRGWVDASGAHVVARSVVHAVSAGPLTIATVEAVDSVDVNAAGVVKDRPALTLSGVALAGQPASIDDTGVHVAGRSAPLPTAALAQQGLTVALLGTSKQDAVGIGRSAAAGLLLTFSAQVSGVPQTLPGIPSADRSYLGSITIGGAGAVVAAGLDPGLALAGLPPAPAGSSVAQLLRSQAGSSTSGALGSVAAASTPRGGTARPGVAAQPTTVPLAGWLPLPDLRTAALLLMLLPLALLITWRGTALLTRRPQ